MTKLLEKVITAASKLPDEEQDRWASLWLDELSSGQRWDAAFEASEKQLEKLVEEALAEHHAGKTRDLDPNAL